LLRPPQDSLVAAVEPRQGDVLGDAGTTDSQVPRSVGPAGTIVRGRTTKP
jgi:hypothetical protein